MRDKKKAGELLLQIVASQNEESALIVLNNILSELYLTSDYTFLVKLKDVMKDYQRQFKDICSAYNSSGKTYHEIDEIRTNCAFLFREINDELSFDIDRLKIHHEMDKTVRRYTAMVNMKDDVHFKTKSASAVREIIGGDPGYIEHVSLSSMSYGLWKEKSGLLDSIKLFTDALSSRARLEFTIETQDVK